MRRILREWRRVRVRIRARRRMVAGRVAWHAGDGNAIADAWSRLPLALAWRRRRRDRAVRLSRIVQASGSHAAVQRLTQVRSERWLTFIRRHAERHATYETHSVRQTAIRIAHITLRAPSQVRSDVTRGPGAFRMAAALEARRGSAVRDELPLAHGRVRFRRPSVIVVPPRASHRTTVVWPAPSANREYVRWWSTGASVRRSASRLEVPQAAAAFRSRLSRLQTSVIRSGSARQSPVAFATTTVRHRTSSDQPTGVPRLHEVSQVESPALVWRSTRTATADAPAGLATKGASSASPIQPVSAREQLTPPFAAAAAVLTREQTSGASPLSGPAIDRLAEDVLGRIERRIRIERERRGL